MSSINTGKVTTHTGQVVAFPLASVAVVSPAPDEHGSGTDLEAERRLLGRRIGLQQHVGSPSAAKHNAM